MAERPRIVLQCGHGCDTVESHHEEEQYVDIVKLQCGHGCDTVERIS
jgi:hypothetical protein